MIIKNRRARLEQLAGKKHAQSFLCYEMKQASFDFFWHYHPEYELVYIISGNGKRLVGSSFESFSPGDLVLIGPGLPHTWISTKNKNKTCRAIVTQFSKEFISPLLQYEELNGIKKLLQKSEKGVQFLSGKRNEVNLKIQQLVQLPEPAKLIQLIQVLQNLAGLKQVQLNAFAIKPLKGNFDQRRINKVLQYIQNSYRQKLSLKKAATLAHLSESGFCKYFKRACGKTFSDYVNEIRVAHACQLLIETEQPIYQVAFDSGFESLTYFNRIFLKKKKSSPKIFRQLD